MTLAATSDSPVARRLATLAIGLLTVASGVGMMIRAELGVAPWDVLVTGVSAASGIDVGIAAMAVPFGFVILGWVLGRPPGPGTLAAVLVVGPVLGVVLDVLPETAALPPRLGLYAAGFLFIAAGITAVIVAEIGPGPAEIVMLAINDKGVALAPARTIIELSCVGAGWAMGGQIGAGTVVVALSMGPVLRRMLTAAGYAPAVAATASECASPGA